MPRSIETFKGDSIALQGKVFTVGADQVARYDKTMKAVLGYIADKFDHRVTVVIKHKDKEIAKKLIKKPDAPMIKDPKDATKKILDKDGTAYLKY